MLRVTVEILPCGNESKKRPCGTLYITNNLSHPRRPVRGSYTVRLTRPGCPERTGAILDFPRRHKNAWDLALLALQATVGED